MTLHKLKTIYIHHCDNFHISRRLRFYSGKDDLFLCLKCWKIVAGQKDYKKEKRELKLIYINFSRISEK